MQMYFFFSTWGNFLSKIGVSLLDISQKAVTLRQHFKQKPYESKRYYPFIALGNLPQRKRTGR